MNEVKKSQIRSQQIEDAPALTTTAGGVARMLNVSVRQVWRLHSLGQLPLPVRLGACVRWRVQEIKDFVAAGCPDRETWEKLTTRSTSLRAGSEDGGSQR